jgi:hypothetical protein
VKIFIGSSGEARDNDLLSDVATWIEGAGHQPLRWDAPEAMTLGVQTFAVLRRIAQRVDGAVFIFSEDDQVWYRGRAAEQPRDNVLIEYGLFSAILGEERVVICRAGRPRTASDLLGINYIDMSLNQRARAERFIRQWLRNITENDNGFLAGERLDSPFQASGKRSLFLKGTELVARATKRVALVAKTPIVLAGCRPYDNSLTPFKYEADQMETYANLIEKSANGTGPRFVCVAALAALQSEIAANRDTLLPARVRQNCEMFTQKAEQPGSQVHLRWYDGSAPMTFLVSDDDFMIWFKDASGESVWITANDEVVARALFSRAEALGSTLDASTALEIINGSAS